MSDREYVQGTVIQVLRPDEAEDYMIGDTARLFSDAGYTVVVVKDESHDPTLLDYARMLLPWTTPSHVYDVLVDEGREPPVSEGDTVSWLASPVDELWYVVPSNPLEVTP